jgi:uncharacterized RmlC-like cupin family protein
MSDPVRGVRPSDLTDGPVSPGMQRRQAFATDRVWSGLVHTDAGSFSAWHHHGDNASVIYVVTGGLRLESGAGGMDVFEATPGDFVYIPPYAVHREGNTTEQVASIVVTRAGSGESLFNVDGPEALVSSGPDDEAG